jgi:cytochrome c
MDSFEINKILGALLGTLLFTLGLSIAAGGIFAPKMPAKPGYEIAVIEAPAAGSAQAAVQPDEPIETLLAKADPQKGANSAKKCLVCHTFEKGGPNKVGPDLWGIVGRRRASHAGFAYSNAMKAKPGEWTFDDLNKFLANPRAFLPGTSMAFIGLNRPAERGDVIAYLNTLSDSPKPLPKPQ